jgi:hypothetical protein
MNLKNKTRLSAFMIVSLTLLIFSCKDDEGTSEPHISSVAPESGVEGSTVTITGHNFSATPSENSVKFNGTTAAVSSSSDDQIVATVPVGATTGKITVTVGNLTATSPNDFEIFEAAEITSLSPLQGVAGTVVIITGTNFSATAAQNVVKFGNNTTAEVIDATTTELVVAVPELAVTGTISVTVNGATATSAESFTILAPTITSINPMIGGQGSTVSIKGTNFSTTEAFDKVKFNNVSATVTAATSDELTVTVPAGATTGKITVTVGNTTVTSVADFYICNGPELGISAGSATANGASTNYSITLTNYGTVDINLAQWGYQNYASVNEVYEPGDAGGGGAQMDSHGILSPGQSLTINSSAGVNSVSYNYYILTINVKDGQTVNECLTSNNVLAVPIIK